MVLRFLSDSFDSLTNKLPDVVVSPIDTVKQQLQTTPLSVLQGDIVRRVDSAARRAASKDLIDELLLARSTLDLLTKTQKKRRKQLIEQLRTQIAGSPLEKRSSLLEERLNKTKKTVQKHYLPAYTTYKKKQLKASRAEQLSEILKKTIRRFEELHDSQTPLARLFVPEAASPFDLSDSAKTTKKKLHDVVEKEVTHLYRAHAVTKKFDRKLADLMTVSKDIQANANDTTVSTKRKQLTKELTKLYGEIDSHYQEIEKNHTLQETIREDFLSSVATYIDTQKQHLTGQTKETSQKIKQLAKEVDETQTKRDEQSKQLDSITTWLTKLSEVGVDGLDGEEELLTPEPAIYQQHSQVMLSELVSIKYGYVYLMRDLLVEHDLLDFKHDYLDTQLHLRKEQRSLSTLTERLLRRQLKQIKTIRTNMVEISALTDSSLKLTDKVEGLVKKTTSLQQSTEKKLTPTSSLKRSYQEDLEGQKSERASVTTNYEWLETDLVATIYSQEIKRLKSLEDHVKQIKQAAKKAKKQLIPEHKKAHMRCEEAEQTASLRQTQENKKQAKQCKKQVEQVELLKEIVAHTYEFHTTLQDDITDLLANYTTELRAVKKKEKALTTQLKKHTLLVEKQNLTPPVHTIDSDNRSIFSPDNSGT